MVAKKTTTAKRALGAPPIAIRDERPERSKSAVALVIIGIVAFMILNIALGYGIAAATRTCKVTANAEYLDPMDMAQPNYSLSPPTFSSTPTAQTVFYLDPTHQSLAQQEAETMRKWRITNRHVGKTIGDFEGCGHSSCNTCIPPTCTPPPRQDGRNWVLSADAISCDRTGCYRVRAWKVQ